MDRRLPAFVRALRIAGVRASISEEIDAGLATASLGMADRGRLHAALRATLVKDRRDLAAFDRLFAAFFDAPASLAPLGSDDTWRAIAAEVDGRAREVAEALAAGDAARLEALFAEAQERIDLPLTHPFQRGLLTYRLAQALGLDALRARAARGAPSTPGIAALEAQLARYVERALARAGALAAGPAARAGLLAPFEPGPLEQEAARRAAAILAERLRGQAALRRRAARRGPIDVRATIRRSCGTGGVPFDPRHRRVRPSRPRIVALCDVSPSMRAATRFTLLFLHSISMEVARVRSFLFVDGIDEVTGLFRERNVARAVARAMEEADLDLSARTDYGASLADFERRHGRALDHRTTVIVLGDGRSNYGDPGIETMRRIRRRTRRVLFLNPEPRAAWGTGDSAMLRFASVCDTEECRRPEDLLRIAADWR